MVFLILLVAAWGILVLPQAREHHWSRPLVSARRHRSSMRMVAPLTESEVRRLHSRLEEPKRRARERRRDIIAFLLAGAVSAAVSGVLSDSTLAWPTFAAFSAVLMGYVGAILESDRRGALRRIEARRVARASVEAAAESPFAEAV